MSDLLPCPFCGGEATRLVGKYDFGGDWFETGCDNVGCPVLPSIKTLSQDHADESWNTRTALDALLKAERERALREAADVCTYVIKNYDVMEPGKPDQFASLKTQKAAKGMVSLARQDIEALIKKDATDG